MNQNEYFEEISHFHGNADQAFWACFAHYYPPSNWDTAFAELAAAVPPEVAAIIEEHGVDLAVYVEGHTYPSGARELKPFAIWSHPDGYFSSAWRDLHAYADASDDDSWYGAIYEFAETIAHGLYDDVKDTPEVATFLKALDAYPAHLKADCGCWLSPDANDAPPCDVCGGCAAHCYCVCSCGASFRALDTCPACGWYQV